MPQGLHGNLQQGFADSPRGSVGQGFNGVQGYGDVRQGSNFSQDVSFNDTPGKNLQPGSMSNGFAIRNSAAQDELWGSVQTQEDPFRSPIANGTPSQRRKSEESGAGMSEKQKWSSAARSAEKLGSG